MRKISKIPFKVLDAPELQDDFYLNLVDWSSQNVLSVGLGTSVYLWSACTSQVSVSCQALSLPVKSHLTVVMFVLVGVLSFEFHSHCAKFVLILFLVFVCLV